jgi:hypothetical protein
MSPIASISYELCFGAPFQSLNRKTLVVAGENGNECEAMLFRAPLSAKLQCGPADSAQLKLEFTHDYDKKAAEDAQHVQNAERQDKKKCEREQDCDQVVIAGN